MLAPIIDRLDPLRLTNVIRDDAHPKTPSNNGATGRPTVRCGHCKSLAPAYEQAAKALKGIVAVGAVDADTHKSLGGEYGVRGFPTIKVNQSTNNTVSLETEVVLVGLSNQQGAAYVLIQRECFSNARGVKYLCRARGTDASCCLFTAPLLLLLLLAASTDGSEGGTATASKSPPA